MVCRDGVPNFSSCVLSGEPVTRASVRPSLAAVLARARCTRMRIVQREWFINWSAVASCDAGLRRVRRILRTQAHELRWQVTYTRTRAHGKAWYRRQCVRLRDDRFHVPSGLPLLSGNDWCSSPSLALTSCGCRRFSMLRRLTHTWYDPDLSYRSKPRQDLMSGDTNRFRSDEEPNRPIDIDISLMSTYTPPPRTPRALQVTVPAILGLHARARATFDISVLDGWPISHRNIAIQYIQPGASSETRPDTAGHRVDPPARLKARYHTTLHIQFRASVSVSTRCLEARWRRSGKPKLRPPAPASGRGRFTSNSTLNPRTVDVDVRPHRSPVPTSTPPTSVTT